MVLLRRIKAIADQLLTNRACGLYGKFTSQHLRTSNRNVSNTPSLSALPIVILVAAGVSGMIIGKLIPLTCGPKGGRRRESLITGAVRQGLHDYEGIENSTGQGNLNATILPDLLHSDASPPPPPPPMPHLSNGSIPPPPPMGGLNVVVLPKKNIPASSKPLKSLNWSKLPDAQVSGTIWKELDETKLYKSMDLKRVDELFCANQTNGSQTIKRKDWVKKEKPRVVSVIDGRRAQNCTILLSKLKMTDEEICKVILSMDSKDQLPIEMLDLLLKFTPSAEERPLLEEHANDKSLGRADKYLLAISKIDHYEQRLRDLHYKKRFKLTVGELMDQSEHVKEASLEMAKSKRLRELLKIVLAMGNYLNNSGARGNASGFRLASLNRLGDTRSGSGQEMTLLHYLAQFIETNYPDLLKLDDDLSHIGKAAKVSMVEMAKEVEVLRKGFGDISQEVQNHQKGAIKPQQGDQYLSVMKDFEAQASPKLTELEKKFGESKASFDKTAQAFGEDPLRIQPDEFFGILDTFLNSFKEARHGNEMIKKRQEEEEKRVKQQEQMKKGTVDKQSSEKPVDKPPAMVGLLSTITQKLGLKSSPTTSKNVPATAVIKDNSPSGPKVKNNRNKPEANQDMVCELQTHSLFRRQNQADDRSVSWTQ